MTTATLNPVVASGAIFQALVRFFKVLIATGKPAAVRESTWADGARFM